MTIDNRLSWSKHITNIKISCQKKLDILKHLSYKNLGADRKSLLRLYIMLIKPKIDYGCEAYSSACKSTLEKLDPIQNAAIRLGLGSFKSSPIYSLMSESGIKPLYIYRNIKIVNFTLRILVNEKHPIHEELMQRFAEMNDLNDQGRIRNCYIDRAINIFRENNLQINLMMKEDVSKSPPWGTNIKMCTNLFKLNKTRLTSLAALFTLSFSCTPT